MNSRSSSVSAVSAIALFAAAGVGQAADPTAVPGGKVLATAGAAQFSLQEMLDSIEPYPLPQLAALPQEARALIDPLGATDAPAPTVIAGKAGPMTVEKAANVGEPTIAATNATRSGIKPFDYGRDKLSTVYHYTDRLLDGELADNFPYRTVGWLVFVDSKERTFRCTAQLIGLSIGVTAGHCVHDGGTQEAGWIISATFYPAYIDGYEPYGSASVDWVDTTGGWYNTGALDAGYDVGIFTLKKRSGTTTEIGAYTGYAGFCVAGCLQSYWYLTQLGYPGNYYDGQYMTQGEHLEVSDTRDYIYGSGMQGGSSGGGHFANLGELAKYTAGSLGYWPYRNIVFATTSWGYTDATLKIQGASSLSGPNNSNDFKGLYNGACNRARALHGTASCTPLS